MRTKGAQTYGFILFLLWKISRVSSICSPELKLLADAAQALVDMVELWHVSFVNGAQMPAEDIQASMDFYKTYLEKTVDFNELKVPKRHLMVHLIARIPWYGNPLSYACWVDESLNRQLKSSCRMVSQATFESSILLATRAANYRYVKKRKR